MQMQTKKRSSQPWWVIILLIPMLVSCNGPIGAIIWKITLIVGEKALETAVGRFIEKGIDEVICKLMHTCPGDKIPDPVDSPGYVILDPNDPLQGTYSKTMKLKGNYEGKTIIYEIPEPRMVRDSISSENWRLGPNLKGLVEQKFTGGS